MIKIKIDLDYMKEACNVMEKASSVYSEKIKNENRIFMIMEDYWTGPDFDQLKDSWNTFTVNDIELRNQVIQYAKYLVSFYKEASNIQKDIKKIARNLPQ